MDELLKQRLAEKMKKDVQGDLDNQQELSPLNKFLNKLKTDYSEWEQKQDKKPKTGLFEYSPEDMEMMPTGATGSIKSIASKATPGIVNAIKSGIQKNFPESLPTITTPAGGAAKLGSNVSVLEDAYLAGQKSLEGPKFSNLKNLISQSLGTETKEAAKTVAKEATEEVAKQATTIPQKINDPFIRTLKTTKEVDNLIEALNAQGNFDRVIMDGLFRQRNKLIDLGR